MTMRRMMDESGSNKGPLVGEDNLTTPRRRKWVASATAPASPKCARIATLEVTVSTQLGGRLSYTCFALADPDSMADRNSFRSGWPTSRPTRVARHRR